MPQNAERLAPLSVHHAFVVHFRVNSEVAQGRMMGRVEHVASGESTHFASVKELLPFMGRVLATVRAPPRRRRAKRLFRQLTVRPCSTPFDDVSTKGELI